MSEAPKFTPGPWEFEHSEDAIWADDDDGNYPVDGSIRMASALEDPGYYRVHHAVEIDWDIEPKSPSYEEAKANIALLVAAPDLYAALSRMVEWEQMDVEIDTYPEMMRAAQAALSKARGETP